MDKISKESLVDLPNIHLHSKSQKHFLNKHRHASLISVSLVPITPLLGDLRFYYPISYFSVICHSEGYNWKTAVQSLSRNHGNSAGRSGLNCPRLFGWNDRFFGNSYFLQGPISDVPLHSSCYCVLTLGFLSLPISICNMKGKNLNRLWQNLH